MTEAGLRRGGAASRFALAARAFEAAWGCAYAALLALLVWSRGLQLPWLILATLALASSSALLALRYRDRSASRTSEKHLAAVLVLLFMSCLVAFATTLRLGQLSTHWDDLVEARDAKLRTELTRRMEALVASGHDAAERAAARIDREGMEITFTILDEVRDEFGLSAMAAFDESGELVAWSGDHRGLIPQSIRTAPVPVAYEDRALFSYLYFGAPVRSRPMHVVAAELITTGLPPRAGVTSALSDRFQRDFRSRPLFAAGPGRNTVWNLIVNGDTLLHARFDPITQAEWRANTAGTARRVIVTLGAAVLLLLATAWLRTRSPSAVPLATGALAVAVAPIGAAFGLERAFSPALFMLPGVPGDVSLGTLLAILLPVCALAATARPRALDLRGSRIAILIGALAVSFGFVGGLDLALIASSWSLLASSGYLWLGVHPAIVLMLSILVALALPHSRATPRNGRHARVVALGGGIVTSAALALLLLEQLHSAHGAGIWFAALWAIPFLFFAFGILDYAGSASRLLRWLIAGWLAATAVLPQFWAAHVDARLRTAERELSTLGTRPDPYLEYLLRQFAAEVQRRHATGEEGVQLAYRSWQSSGLPSESYPTRIAVWDSAGRQLVDLGLGGANKEVIATDSLPTYLRQAIESARARGSVVLQSVQGQRDVNQVMAVPLGGGEVVSVVVPPRRSFDRVSILSPFLGTQDNVSAQLNLVPARPGAAHPPTGEVQWYPQGNGWRSETDIAFPEGDYHAHLEVVLPSTGVRFARGVLLIALDLALLTILWFLGRAARGDVPTPPGGWLGWMRGFRARVTAALFTFFLIPTALFGWVAYRALAGEVERAAEIVAEHAAEQAAHDFPESMGDLRQLSASTGEEVLYYHRTGELLSASSPEALELGLFNAWMAAPVWASLLSGEEISALEHQHLGRFPYLAAYRKLPVTGIIAVPVSLLAGDTSVRQNELAHLILFASLIGLLLSFALSVEVGRALAKPIGQLRRAASAVGAGQFRVHLPENRPDEFGDLFASFNRMARRLRRARAQELRTARVLAWGEMARQIAHEIKNPLTPIKLSVQHLRRAYADRRPDFDRILETNVEQILKEIDSLAEISRAFSRYGAPAGGTKPVEPVRVHDVVHEAITLYRASETDIEYIENVAPDLPPAQARAGELKEVVLNLLENARAALDGSGRITVSAVYEDGGIELCVEDNGPGIPEEFLPRVFEPHFSTRSAGTGLGLAIVRRIVESWNGTVVAESAEGRGTVVRIRMLVFPKA